MSFDGREFSDEASAKKHERHVRDRGIEIRKEFLAYIDEDMKPLLPEIRDLVKSFSDDDAWKIVRAMRQACEWFHDENPIIQMDFGENDEWMYGPSL